MTLAISIAGGDRADVPRLDGDTSFGFERYRQELWGTDAVRSVGAEMISRLGSQNISIENCILDELEQEARSILDNVDSIAAEVFDASAPARGAVVLQAAALAVVDDAWGGNAPAESIRRYVGNLLRAIVVARETGCGIDIS